MSVFSEFYPRALVRGAGCVGAGAAVLGLGVLVAAGPASAHVRVTADDAVRGESAVLTFRVPNESETGSPTTGLTVALPDLTSVSTAVMPGWTATLDRDTAAGTVRSVTWKAEPGTGVGTDQFGLFVLRAKLPDSAAVSFPATQTYADGTVVRWDQPEAVGGEEPEYPAPTLGLDSGSAQAAVAPSGREPDIVARVLAGGALLVSALGVAAALLRRRA
ncbi:MAG: YcnI family protein [Mycobacterium sp.]|nr:YcnI family protein [Mycobacterium sp.]